MIQIYQQRLFIVYNRAKWKTIKSDYQAKEKLINRLNKAFRILQSKDYYQDEKALYNPSTISCGCKDYEFRHATKRAYDGPCGHMIAERLIVMMQSIKYQQTNFFHIIGE